jgi:hypothetical protein
MDSRELALELLQRFRDLKGQIPYDMRADFAIEGVALRSEAFAPKQRATQCTGMTLKGTQCKSKSIKGGTCCKRHTIAAAEAADPVEPILCTAETAKGEPCKCKPFKELSICWRHARKANLLPEVPSECAVCYEAMDASTRTKTKCNHYMHTSCLTTWAQTKGYRRYTRRVTRLEAPCPMCRTPFTIRAPENVLDVAAAIPLPEMGFQSGRGVTEAGGADHAEVGGAEAWIGWTPAAAV